MPRRQYACFGFENHADFEFCARSMLRLHNLTWFGLESQCFGFNNFLDPCLEVSKTPLLSAFEIFNMTRVVFQPHSRFCPEMTKRQMQTMAVFSKIMLARKRSYRLVRCRGPVIFARLVAYPIRTLWSLDDRSWKRYRVYQKADREWHVGRWPRNQRFKLILTPRRQAVWF